MFGSLRRYSRWVDAAFLVFYVIVLAIAVVSRSWLWATIAAIWIVRETFGLIRPSKPDQNPDVTPAEPVFRSRVELP